MKTLTLHTNRKFIKIFILVCLIICLILTIFLSLGFIFAKNEKDILSAFIVCATISCVFVVLFLLLCFLPKTKFVFTENSISIIKANFTQTIDICNVQTMEYYKFKWWYIFILAVVPLPKGGCMKIHLYDKQNKKYILGTFSYKEAVEIQKLYPSMLKID